MYNSKNIFIITFLFIISTYIYVFGENKTMEILQNEYILFSVLIFITIAFFILRFKVKNENIDLSSIPKTPILPIKQSIVFFIVFCAIDYYSEDGFEGMITQWIIYWIFGLISLVLLNFISFYKVYKMVKIKE